MPSYRRVKDGRDKRKARVRKKVVGTTQRPRLSVFRSTRHIYAQIIDDASGKTLFAASTLEKEFSGVFSEMEQELAKAVEEAEAKLAESKGKKKKGKGPKVAMPDTRNKIKQARTVGRLIAKKATTGGLKQVVFDRNGFLYHGRISALADGAREGGLKF